MTSYASGCPYWWWYVGIPEGQLLDVVGQNAARIIDVNRYPGCGSRCYDLLLINNSTSEDDLDDTFTATKAELLREQIHAGLASCFHQTYLPLVVR